MQRSFTIRLPINSFWLSVLLHLLLILLLSTMILSKPKENQQKSPQYYVPSYVYKGAIRPSFKPMQKTAKQSAQKQKMIQENVENNLSSQITPNTEKPEKSIPIPKKERQKQSVLASSMKFLQENQLKMIDQSVQQRDSDPIYMVGDLDQPADPLVKLLGRALSAHFEYPRIAGEFGIKGRVLVSMTLQLNGRITDIQMVRSSDNPDLDAAALYACNNAPAIFGVDRFISKPKHFVVGFIFR